MTEYEPQIRKMADGMGWEWRVAKDGQTVERQVYDGFGPRRCSGVTMTRWGARRMAVGTIRVLTKSAMPPRRWESA